MTDTSRIRFYTRQGCPLCDEALEIVRPLASKAKLPLDIIDVDLDLALMERFNDRVPVVELGDEILAEGIIEANPLKRALKTHRPR